MSKLLVSILCALLTSCALTEKPYQKEKPTREFPTIESKQRVYPQHTRNGVYVQPTNTWYLGTGTHFEKNLPKIKVSKPLVEKNNYYEYEKNRKLELEKKALKEDILRIENKSRKLISDNKMRSQVKNIINKWPKATPPINENIKNKQTEIVTENKTSNLTANEKLSLFKSTDETPFFDFDISKLLTDVHNQKFVFIKNTITLTNESRERLVYLSPHLLAYGKIDVIGSINGTTTEEVALKRAYILKMELLRVGVKSNSINVVVEKRDGHEARLYAAHKRILKTATIGFTGQDNTPDKNDVLRLTANINPSKVDWVRLIASSNFGHPINRALRIKDALINIGVSKDKITILHRHETRNEVKAQIYYK
jgi:outer membrane protein OmpA-like peptidoglycan-associated protein